MQNLRATLHHLPLESGDPGQVQGHSGVSKLRQGEECLPDLSLWLGIWPSCAGGGLWKSILRGQWFFFTVFMDLLRSSFVWAEKTGTCRCQVRDKYLEELGANKVALPHSRVGRDYQLQNAQADKDGEDLPYGKVGAHPMLQRLARMTPYYKRNEARICTFYVKGACNRGQDCPFKHELPQGGQRFSQNAAQTSWRFVWSVKHPVLQFFLFILILPGSKQTIDSSCSS